MTQSLSGMLTVLALILGANASAAGEVTTGGLAAAELETAAPPPLVAAPSGVAPGVSASPNPEERDAGVASAGMTTQASPSLTPADGPELRLGRGAAGVVGGLLGAGVLGGVSLMASMAVLCAMPNSGYCGIGALVYGIGGAVLGQPLGAWLTGNLFDGDGNLLATLAGSALGYLAFGAAVALSGGYEPPMIVLAAPLLLAPIFYELTSNPSAKHARATSSIALLPSLVPTREGVAPALALGGYF